MTARRGWRSIARHGAKVADCARSTRCGQVQPGPFSSRPWEFPGRSTALPTREFCWESPFLSPVHGSGQLLGRSFSGGEGSRGFPPADWHGGCYLHPSVVYPIRAGRPYGFLTEPRGNRSVRGQRAGDCGVPGEPEWGGRAPGPRPSRRPERPVPAPFPSRGDRAHAVGGPSCCSG